jgi:hypothetical protein
VTTDARLEVDWMEAATDALTLTGWRWAHVPPTRRKAGRWSNENSGKGFPDLVCLRAPRVLWVEVKRQGNGPTPQQETWIAGLAASGQEAHVLTFPADWPLFDALIARDEQLSFTTGTTGTGANWAPITKPSEV